MGTFCVAMRNLYTLAGLLAFSVVAAAQTDCPNGWKSFGNSCYLFVLPTLKIPVMTWEEARTNCLGYGGDLVSITNTSEVDFIYSLTTTFGNNIFWIGLYRNKTTNDPKEGWIWSDGSNFTNPSQWASGEPNNFLKKENCAEVYGKRKHWNDNDCNKGFASICERSKGKPLPTSAVKTTASPTTGKPPTCDYGWEVYGDSCYKFEKISRIWSDARRACRDTGGHLVTIDDAKEQNYLAYKVRNFYWTYWIGLNSLGVDGRWVWESASNKTVKFTNWQSGEPNSPQERCVEMYGHSHAGFWNDASCGWAKKYICEKEQGRNMCPDNWIPYNDSCYQFNLGASQLMTWDAAQKACNATGGYSTLVTIKSKNEQDFITKQVQAFSNSEVWIGLSDIATEAIFKWSDGSSLENTGFSIWANGKPIENKESNDCVTMLGVRIDGAWSVRNCTLKKNFICMRNRDLTYCNVPIGMENGNILDSQITASSFLSDANRPEKARFRHSSSWCPANNDKNPYIQVDLGSVYEIRKIILEGNVTSYSLRYGNDGKQYQDYGTLQSGLFKLDSKVVKARFVRVSPLKFRVNSCLRLEFVGCVAQVPKITDCSGKNWEKSKTFCYQINRSFRTWTDARSVCLDQGSDLLSIRSVEERDAITKRIRVLVGIKSLWISLNDRDFTDFQYWSNGDAKSLVNWDSGSPSNPLSAALADKFNLKACVEMATSNGKWRDIDCNSRRAFICMKRTLETRPPSTRNVVKYGSTGVWISTAKYYWPLSSIQDGRVLGTIPGKVYGNVTETSGIKKVSNNALQFSGPGSYVDTGDFGQKCLTFPDACANGLTISFMASFDNTAASWSERVNILDSVGRETNSVGIAVYVQKRQLWFVLSKTYKVITRSIAINGDRTWRHYVMRWNESGMYINVNAKPITTRASTSVISVSRTDQQKNFLIGIQKTAKVAKSGRVNIAMVAFWDFMLTADDIASIYNSEFGRCPVGWVEFGMSCYQFNKDRKYHWIARARCQSAGGYLVNIQSPVEQAYITQQLTETSWIGVKDDIQEGIFTEKNGEIIRYSNWNLWEPNDYGSWEDCTSILAKGGLWNDVPCYWHKLQYICEKPKDLPASLLNTSIANIPKFLRVCQYTRDVIGCPAGYGIKIGSAFWGRRRKDVCGYISVTNCGIDQVDATTKKLQQKCDGAQSCDLHATESLLGNQCPTIRKYLEVNYTCVPETMLKRCPSGWKYFEKTRSCYRLFHSGKTWMDARSTCKKNNGELISIANSPEQSLATSLMGRAWYSNVWIGLNDLQTKGVYRWSDSSPVAWTNWYAGQPDEIRTDNSCVYMSLDRSKRGWMFWRDGNCNSSFAFICKNTSASSTQPTTKPSISSGSCLQGWISDNKSQYCYRAISDKKTWQEARKYCRQMAVGFADLTSIRDQQENEFVRKLINISMWIGLDARGIFRGHIWSDKTPVAYTNWGIGQPDSYNGRQACVDLDPDTGYWSDTDCYTTKPFVCKRLKSKKPASTPAPTTYPTSGSSLCKQGWTLFNGMCYFVGNDTASDFRTWHDAESICASMNGHLVSIGSKAEQSFLVYLMKGKKSQMHWIGLNDLGSESNYKWSDGTGYGAYFNWNTHEPNDSGRQEDCVHMWGNGKWNDNHCTRKLPYMCKRYNESYHPLVTTGPPRPSTDGYCPLGWIANGRWCYEFHTDPSDYRTWDAARESCERGTNSSSFGELVSIHDEFEEAFITIHLKGSDFPLWIGLNNRHTYTQYGWVDNSPTDYWKWDTGEPRFRWRKCIAIAPYPWAAGRWNTVYCNEKHGYICKSVASRTPITATPAYTPTPTGSPSFTCPDGYKAYEKSCYKFIKARKTFDDARKTCKSEDADLFNIDSPFKQAYLIYLLERDIDSVWIGLLHEPYSSFKLTDNSSPIFTYWGAGQPNRQLGQRSCTQANITGSNIGRWDDVDCNRKNLFVCEIYHGEPRTTIPINSTCPDGWLQYDKFCYKHFDDYKTWAQAQYQCSSKNSDLISIHDDREQDFILHYYQNKPHSSVWTGLNDRSVEQGYRWVDNTGLNYVNWDADQPNDRNGAENCVQMNNRRGVWSDAPCSMYFPYMCKKKLECTSVLQIDPSMITVTESINASFGANQAIIQDDKANDLAWCTNNTSGNAKLSIDLGRLVTVTGVAIQGRNTPTAQFVESFRIDYEEDEYWKEYVPRQRTYGTLQGNRDGKSIVIKSLKPPITLDGISITPLTWAPGGKICMKIRLYGCNYVCQNGLIKQKPRNLKDDFITSSSANYPKNGPIQAAQNGNSWCAKINDKQQWIQVNFGVEQFVSKIRTFGDGKESFVKTYKIQFSGDGVIWIDYQQYGTVRIFKGNNGARRPMVHILANPIEALYIRILPLAWNKNICMRFQLLGCPADCEKALLDNAGSGNGDVKISSSAGPDSHPEYAVFSSGKAWCTNKSPLKKQYLQIDFGRRMRLTKIATQKNPQSYGKPRQVSTFTVSFLTNGGIWRKYWNRDRINAKIFIAYDQESATSRKINTFSARSLVTRKLRIFPEDFKGNEICMRVEVYGCLAGAEITPTQQPTKQKIVNVAIRIMSMEWDNQFKDEDSEAFDKARKQIEGAVRSLYKDSESLRSVTVLQLKQGSVVAIMKLVFNPEFSENATQTLHDAVNTGKIGSLQVDKKYFRIIDTDTVTPKAQKGNKSGGLSGGAVAGIVIAVLLLVGLGVVGGFLFSRHRKRKQLFAPQHFENPISYSSKAYDMDD